MYWGSKKHRSYCRCKGVIRISARIQESTAAKIFIIYLQQSKQILTNSNITIFASFLPNSDPGADRISGISARCLELGQTPTFFGFPFKQWFKWAFSDSCLNPSSWISQIQIPTKYIWAVQQTTNASQCSAAITTSLRLQMTIAIQPVCKWHYFKEIKQLLFYSWTRQLLVI